MQYRSFLALASTAILLLQDGVHSNGVTPFVGQELKKVQGTYWRTNVWTTSCLFDTWKQPLLYYTAIAKDLYQKAAYCGVCVSVTLPNSKKRGVIGVINDVCADCPAGALDLAPDFYNAVVGNSPNRPGKTTLSWTVVPCPFADKSVTLTKKQGSSKYHLSLQIAGTLNPLESVSIMPQGRNGKEIPAVRTDYNYYELPHFNGVLPDVISVKVTCTNNVHFIIDDVKLGDSSPMRVSQNC